MVSYRRFDKWLATSLALCCLTALPSQVWAQSSSAIINPPVAGATDPLNLRKAFQLENDPLVSITLRNASAESVLRLLAQKANLSLIFMVESGDQSITTTRVNENTQESEIASTVEGRGEDTVKTTTSQMRNLTLTIPYIELKNVPLSEAFSFVLRVSGLTGRRVYSSLIITTPERMEKLGFSAPVIKTYTLYNQASSVVAGSSGGAAPATGGSGGIETQLKTIFETRGVSPAPKMISDSRTSTLILMGSQEAIDIADRMIPILDKALPQVVVEIKLIELTKQASQELGLSYGFAQGKFGAGYNLSPAGAGAGAAAAGGAAGGAGGATPIVLDPINQAGQNPTQLGNPNTGAGGTVITFNSLSDFSPNFNVRLNALLQNSQAKVLTNPRLSIQHGVKATFDSTTKVPIVSTTATATATVQTVQSLDIGEKVEITPFIDPDKGLVTMRLKPDISTRGASVNISGGAGAGGGQSVPEKNTRSVETTLRVKDGESIVIGGLMRQSSNEAKTKIPLLGDIPLLGALFSSTQTSQEEVELLVIVTPRIMKVD